VPSLKIPEFCNVGGVRSRKKDFSFSVFRVPSTILHTAYRKQFSLNQWYQWKADTQKVSLLQSGESETRHLADRPIGR